MKQDSDDTFHVFINDQHKDPDVLIINLEQGKRVFVCVFGLTGMQNPTFKCDYDMSSGITRIMIMTCTHVASAQWSSGRGEIPRQTFTSTRTPWALDFGVFAFLHPR